MKFSTIAIRAGQNPDPLTGAISFPIYQTSTYAQEEPAKHKGFTYGRTDNPTRRALEMNLASLENAKYGLCFASGLSAINTVLNLLKSGDHLVAPDDLYGGTYRILTKVYEKYGVSATFVDQTNLENFKKAIKKNTKIVWIETPSNPLLKITDIESVTQIAKRSGCLSIVDNTFASPYLQQPLSLGVDIVVHSTTKYLAGHSDVIGGALITNDENLYNELKFYQNTVGAVPGPQDCYLILRGVKTLSLRMERHCLNAGKVSSFLKEHPKVKKVFYPGLSAHIGHSIAKKQMRDFGGMVSFELRTDWAGVLRFTKALKIFTIAESLGTVYSLLNHPASMTHASIPKDIREKNGVTDSLLRLSLGCEDLDDLLEDLKQALTHI